MKKSLLFGIASLALTVGACGGRKGTQESEISDYGKYFIEKLAANQIDSIKDTYPDIVKSVSLVPVKSDTIIVVESEPGKFDVTLAEGITLKVNRSEEGQITVVESKGLFAFPEDKVKLAKKTGMWDDSLSDAQLAERMNDKDFFNWVKKNKTVNTSGIIQIGKFTRSGGKGYYTLKNTTDVPISGSDYSISISSSYPVYDPEMPNAVDHWATKNSSESGKDLSPNGTAQVYSNIARTRVNDDAGPEKEIKGIKWKLSQEQMQEKFASFTGKEYQEYLDSKKN